MFFTSSTSISPPLPFTPLIHLYAVKTCMNMFTKLPPNLGRLREA